MARQRGHLVATQDFTVKFDGPAVESGRMPVRDLAPALLALGELFDVAREVAEPDSPALTLEVRSFERGSFQNLLGLSYDAAVNLLVSDPVGAVLNVFTLVTHGKTGVLAMYRALRGKRIVRTEPTESPGIFLVHNYDGQAIVAPGATINIYQDPRTPAVASGIVKPLREPGVEELLVRGAEEPLIIKKDEVDAIPKDQEQDAPEPEVLADSTRTTLLSIILAPLQDPGRLKWRFTEGHADLWARVTDTKFIRGMETRKEHLNVGDRLKCRLRQIQQDDPEKGLQVEYEVIEVIDHLGASGPPRQIALTDDKESPA